MFREKGSGDRARLAGTARERNLRKVHGRRRQSVGVRGCRPAGSDYLTVMPLKATKVPDRPEWIHEIKHDDGYRLIVQRDGERVRLFTRNGHDWSRAISADHGSRTAHSEFVLRGRRRGSVAGCRRPLRLQRAAFAPARSRMVLFTSDLDPTIIAYAAQHQFTGGMGRRAAAFQSSRLRYCITARCAMLGNSAGLPIIPVCFLGGRSPRFLRGGDSHRALDR